jgi:hypothetical protein
MRTIKLKKDSLKLIKNVLNYLKASPYLWIGAYILPKGGLTKLNQYSKIQDLIGLKW